MLKYIVCGIFPLFACLDTSAQKKPGPIVGTTPRAAVLNFEDKGPDFYPLLHTTKAAPSPAGDYKQKKQSVDMIRSQKAVKSFKGSYMGKKAPTIPLVEKSFLGNISNGTPNDDDMCIGNNGYIISVVNSNIRILDTTGKMIKVRSLEAFAQEVGNLQRAFDPRTLYDPINDRYIVVFLNGNSSADNNPVVCVSQTNDPTGSWNSYLLPGNPFNDTSWSDYPIISISDKDLFLTLNLLQDDKGWKDGFRQSIIWQISLKEAYAGETLKHNLWSNIKYQGKPIWSICPAQGGSKPSGPESHFVSVRPSDLQNDTIFHHTITNSFESGKAELKTRVVVADRKYGLPPSAIQPDKQKLETNDARVLSAFTENYEIHLAGNCIDTNNYAAGIYYAHFTIDSDKAFLQVISSDTLDIGYPDIAYAGGGAGDNAAMITCSHVSGNTFPGNSVIYMDWSYSFSPIIFARQGESSINVLIDSAERWGDYSGIQRKYNENRAFWLAGSYGFNSQNRTAISKIVNTDPALGVARAGKEVNVEVYPNPASNRFHVDFELQQSEKLVFTLTAMDGKKYTLLRILAKAGINNFSFETADLSSGVYILNISGENGFDKSEKVVVHP